MVSHICMADVIAKWQILLPQYCRLIYNHIFRDNKSVYIVTDGKSHVFG